MESGGPIRVALIVALLGGWYVYRYARGAVTTGTWALLLMVGANVASTIVRRGAQPPDGWWAGADQRVITFVANVLIVISLVSLVLFRLFVDGYTSPAAIRHRLRRPLLVAVAAIALFGACTAWAILDDQPLELTNQPGMFPAAGIFALVGRAYMCFVFAETGLWAIRVVRNNARPTQIGLGFVAVGTIVLALATGTDALAALAATLGATVPHDRTLIAVSDSIGALGLVLGICLPVLLGRAQAAGTWLRSWWLHRQLSPLWHAIRALYPELILTVSDAATPRRGDAQLMRFLAIRRLTECADGLARLMGSPPQAAHELAALSRQYYPALVPDRRSPGDPSVLTSAISHDTRALARLSRAVARHHLDVSTDPQNRSSDQR
jgi:Family of unknown function (DUF6545)